MSAPALIELVNK